MAYVHQLEQSQLDGPKDIHKLEEMESKFQKKLLKQRKRKYQEEYEPEHGPSSEPAMPAIPILHNQESGAKENDVHDTSVRDVDFPCNDVHIGSSEVHARGVESLEVGMLVEEPVDATVTSLTREFTTPVWAEENDGHDTSLMDLHGDDVHIGSSEVHFTEVESLEVGTQIVEEPVDATITLLTIPSSGDVIPSLIGSTSTSADQDRMEEGFVFVDNFKIPKEYEILYNKIYRKYGGHIATKKVIKSSDTMLEVCVSDLLRIISAMETTRGAELSDELLNEWEGFIRDAEALKFNVKWFRERFDGIKSQWMSESDEQVLDAMQADYVGLCTKQDELEADLSEVKIQIKKAVAMISSKREAIREKQAQKIFFQNEPVLRIAFD